MKKTLCQFFVILSVLIFITGCSLPSLNISGKKYWIDNPLSEEITISIDGKEHKIAAKSGIKLEIEYGTRELVYNGQKVKFIVKPCHYPVVLNPTLSNYLACPKIYYYNDSEAAGDRGERLLNSFSRDYDFGDGHTEKVPFRVFNSLIIEGYDGKWDYDLGEEFPDEITKYVQGNVSVTADMRIKLFKEDDFVDYIGDSVKLRKPENQNLNDLLPFKIIEDKYLAFDCKEAQSGAEKLKSYIDQLYTTSGSYFAKVYDNFTARYEDRNSLEGHLFPISLITTCQGTNYTDNKRYISQALKEFENMNAWIVE